MADAEVPGTVDLDPANEAARPRRDTSNTASVAVDPKSCNNAASKSENESPGSCIVPRSPRRKNTRTASFNPVASIRAIQEKFSAQKIRKSLTIQGRTTVQTWAAGEQELLYVSHEEYIQRYPLAAKRSNRVVSAAGAALGKRLHPDCEVDLRALGIFGSKRMLTAKPSELLALDAVIPNRVTRSAANIMTYANVVMSVFLASALASIPVGHDFWSAQPLGIAQCLSVTIMAGSLAHEGDPRAMARAIKGYLLSGILLAPLHGLGPLVAKVWHHLWAALFSLVSPIYFTIPVVDAFYSQAFDGEPLPAHETRSRTRIFLQRLALLAVAGPAMCMTCWSFALSDIVFFATAAPWVKTWIRPTVWMSVKYLLRFMTRDCFERASIFNRVVLSAVNLTGIALVEMLTLARSHSWQALAILLACEVLAFAMRAYHVLYAHGWIPQHKVSNFIFNSVTWGKAAMHVSPPLSAGGMLAFHVLIEHVFLTAIALGYLLLALFLTLVEDGDNPSWVVNRLWFPEGTDWALRTGLAATATFGTLDWLMRLTVYHCAPDTGSGRLDGLFAAFGLGAAVDRRTGKLRLAAQPLLLGVGCGLFVLNWLVIPLGMILQLLDRAP